VDIPERQRTDSGAVRRLGRPPPGMPGLGSARSGRFLITLCDLVVVVGAPWAVPPPTPWPWWAPGGTSHQVGWSREARGPCGGATGGAALAFAPGRAARAVFSRGVASEISD
jgi:hypothetical protein